MKCLILKKMIKISDVYKCDPIKNSDMECSIVDALNPLSRSGSATNPMDRTESLETSRTKPNWGIRIRFWLTGFDFIATTRLVLIFLLLLPGVFGLAPWTDLAKENRRVTLGT